MTPISRSWLEDRAEEFKASLAFSTRLPLTPATSRTAKAVANAAWAGGGAECRGAARYYRRAARRRPRRRRGWFRRRRCTAQETRHDARQSHRRVWRLRSGTFAFAADRRIGELRRRLCRRLGADCIALRRARMHGDPDVAVAAGAR